MILALWLRWCHSHRARYLALALAVLALDAVLAPLIVAWEIGVARDVLEGW